MQRLHMLPRGFGYGGPELGTDQGHMDRQIADVCMYVEGSYINW